MIKILRLYLLIISCCLSASIWAEPGGAGKIEVGRRILDLNNACFKPKSGTVSEVCAQYTISWKLWSLMGEPVEDYTLGWQLVSIELKHPQRKLISRFGPDNIPAELKKSVGLIELYIDGYADVITSKNLPSGYLRFNTGTAVRAGAGSSLNVPGSPDWSKLFIAAGMPCNEKASTFMAPELSKKIFSQGFQLNNFRTCPSSDLSELGDIEAAISQLCEPPGADKKYEFCPKQKVVEKKPVESNSIEDAFSKMEKQTGKDTTNKASNKKGSIDSEFDAMEKNLAEQERAKAAAIAEQERAKAAAIAYKQAEDAKNERLRIAAEKIRQQQQAQHDAAVQYCTNVIQTEKNCYKNSCGEKPPEKLISYPEGNFIGSPQHVRLNPQFPQWQSCTQNLAKSCSPNGMPTLSMDDCVKKRESNPQ